MSMGWIGVETSLAAERPFWHHISPVSIIDDHIYQIDLYVFSHIMVLICFLILRERKTVQGANRQW